MKGFKNIIIYILIVIVLSLAIFVLFQYYAGVETVDRAVVKDEPEIVKVMIYYSNSVKNPAMLDCSLVFSVERVVTSREKIYEATINQLLLEPTKEEITLGYKNLIPVGTKLNFVKFDNGILQADFNESLDRGVGGSCLVSAIRSQIERTMQQWPEVKSVVVSIKGESEIILQP
ncbi:MAG: hypothetical protein UT32_C0003G0030 [Parcubacteria group bacterium GW2011_GWC2_39_14]|nr:MAG: hypothetical protein UT32_C0003G0030 [Parcubacteria group bacterium GW2011_GWC2_39_14]KKR54979.1 MAG: hypothetical protein UT91_C0006G0030 [Parcubacteria group bacterium GW2011_GWA2_40_23]